MSEVLAKPAKLPKPPAKPVTIGPKFADSSAATGSIPDTFNSVR